jgi:membrane protein
MDFRIAHLPDQLQSVPKRLRDFASFMEYLFKRYFADDCLTTSAALTYTSLLAVVPLMTIGFAIFRAFPAYETLQQQAQTLILRNLVPEVGDAIQDTIIQFAGNAGQLTAFGIVGLAITSVMLFWTIEGSFSAIWRVSEPRSLVTRLLAFWAILTLTPLLFGASLSLSTYLLAVFQLNPEDDTWRTWRLMLPGVFEWIAFTLIYLLIPNRAVRWQDAVIGALTACVLLEFSKYGFGWYITQFPAYRTIYGALSSIPIFLLWLYIAWSTVLIGAEVAAALPEWRAGKISRIGPEGLLPAQRVAVALAILAELLRASHLGVGMRRRTLIGRVPVGGAIIDGMLEQMRGSHWVARTSQGAWVTTRDLSSSTLYDLLKGLGIGLRGTVKGLVALDAPWQERCAKLLEAADESERDLLCIPIKDLLCPPHEAADFVHFGRRRAGE